MQSRNSGSMRSFCLARMASKTRGDRHPDPRRKSPLRRKLMLRDEPLFAGRAELRFARQLVERKARVFSTRPRWSAGSDGQASAFRQASSDWR